jgi:peptidoglycan/xylan/chitin deacetylase (PgdA/CDA1 family)
MTQIIIRIDDVTPSILKKMQNWFLQNHPNVPVSGFALHTDDWERGDWEASAMLIEEYDWELGGHSRNHIKLPFVEENVAYKEIKTNIADIEKNLKDVGLNYRVQSFSYPFGLYDQQTIELLKDLDIHFGLTFSDGFPYSASTVTTVPTGDERYEWGVVNNGSLDLSSWNYKFDQINKHNGIYTICLHPNRWESVLSNLLEERKYMSYPRSIYNILRYIFLNEESRGWKKLDRHIEYIKRNSDPEFVTYSDLV